MQMIDKFPGIVFVISEETTRCPPYNLFVNVNSLLIKDPGMKLVLCRRCPNVQSISLGKPTVSPNSPLSYLAR